MCTVLFFTHYYPPVIVGVLQSHDDNTVQKKPRIWPPEKINIIIMVMNVVNGRSWSCGMRTCRPWNLYGQF